MRIIVTGASGQRGYNVLNETKKRAHVVCADQLENSDRSVNIDTLQKIQPRAIIHCAALTSTDVTEEKLEHCRKANVGGTRYVTEALRVGEIKTDRINILYLHSGAEMYGADKVLLDLICGLDKKRFSPYVILPCKGVLADKLRNEGIDVSVVPYPIMRRKYFNPRGILKYWIAYLKYSKELVKLSRAKGIDIIHTNTAAVLEGCYVSRKLRIPQLWVIHEIIVSPKIMYRITSRWIGKYSKKAIAVSEAVKKHLMNTGYFSDGQIRVIYNGVDVGRFNPDVNCDYLYYEWNIPRNALVIGMIGRVNRWKGQMDFLKAASIVMEKRSDVYTVFVGDSFAGEEWREIDLAKEIRKSPYKDRIINMGYRKDTEAIYKLIDIFVLPSTNPDPLPTVVLEAMATGKPVVGYKHGGICEMVVDGETGLLAEVRNPDALAEKILYLLNQKEVISAMGNKAKLRLEKDFSLAICVRQYEELYSSMARLII